LRPASASVPIPCRPRAIAARYPAPIVYKFDLLVRTHSFTSSQVLPIGKGGKNAPSFDAAGNTYPAGTVRSLPPSTIYGFNGQFPGPMINAEYGKPVLVRFENHLDENPLNLDRQDFGSPDFSFLTHLHNAHTAPESDGNEAAKVPVPLPGLFGLPHLRVRAHGLDPGSEDRRLAGLQRRRDAGPVPDRGRPAVHAPRPGSPPTPSTRSR
jgi:hypothetical protein